MTQQTAQPLFPLGQVVMAQRRGSPITPGAQAAFAAAGEQPLSYLHRHVAGDWGEVCVEDRRENELSVEKGFRILSAYKLGDGMKVWIITEADRSATTLLLPEEY